MSDAIRSLTFEGLIALARKTAQTLPPSVEAVVTELVVRAQETSEMLCDTEVDLAVVSAERDELRGVVSGARLAYLRMKHPASCPGDNHSRCYEHEDGWYCERGLTPHDCHMESSASWTACRCGVADMGETLGIEVPRG